MNVKKAKKLQCESPRSLYIAIAKRSKCYKEKGKEVGT